MVWLCGYSIELHPLLEPGWSSCGQNIEPYLLLEPRWSWCVTTILTPPVAGAQVVLLLPLLSSTCCCGLDGRAVTIVSHHLLLELGPSSCGHSISPSATGARVDHVRTFLKFNKFRYIVSLGKMFTGVCTPTVKVTAETGEVFQ